MGLVEAFTKLWAPKASGTPADTGSKACVEPKRSTIDCQSPADADITLGVKYASAYAWQITPPAGWRRQENNSGHSWPNGTVSPMVSFSNPILPAGEQAMIRWQMLAVPESAESHKLLDELLSGRRALTPENIDQLAAPGLVTGMKVLKVERAHLPTDQQAVLVSSRMEQCKGEQPIFRHVLIFPDRKLILDGQTNWFRETLQFVATEESFWSNERLAIQSIRTFRRVSADDQSHGSHILSAHPSNQHLIR